MSAESAPSVLPAFLLLGLACTACPGPEEPPLPEPLLDPVEFVWLQAVGIHPDGGEALVANALGASNQVGLCADFFDSFTVEQELTEVREDALVGVPEGSAEECAIWATYLQDLVSATEGLYRPGARYAYLLPQTGDPAPIQTVPEGPVDVFPPEPGEYTVQDRGFVGQAMTVFENPQQWWADGDFCGAEDWRIARDEARALAPSPYAFWLPAAGTLQIADAGPDAVDVVVDWTLARQPVLSEDEWSDPDVSVQWSRTADKCTVDLGDNREVWVGLWFWAVFSNGAEPSE